MGRIRTVKPEFFKDWKLFKAEQETGLPLRLAYESLWPICDREGRFEWIPEELKIECMPYDDIDFSRVLHALSTRGYASKYRVDGRDYGYLPKFLKHQVINTREKASTLPAPNKNNMLDACPTRDDACNAVHVHAQVEGEGEVVKSSVSSLRSETGEKPPDPVKQIFDEGVSLLTKNGMVERDARKLIGQLRKAAKDPGALEAIRAARDKTDPATWLRACCQRPVRLPNDPQALFAIRKAVGLPYEYDDLKACHDEIHSQLRQHPELRPKVEAVA